MTQSFWRYSFTASTRAKNFRRKNFCVIFKILISHQKQNFTVNISTWKTVKEWILEVMFFLSQNLTELHETLWNSLDVPENSPTLTKNLQKHPKISKNIKNIPNSLLNSPKLSLIAWRSPETVKNYPRISKKSLKLSENLQTSAKIIWLS